MRDAKGTALATLEAFELVKVMPQPRATPDNVGALIPAFQEGRHIHGVAMRTKAVLPTVLVVDDGSTDATADEARKAGVSVTRHERNQGKGAAIKTGMRELLKNPAIEFILVLDGDGQHLPEEIPQFLEAANATDAALVVGSRMGDIRKMPFVRKCTNRYMSWTISKLIGQREHQGARFKERIRDIGGNEALVERRHEFAAQQRFADADLSGNLDESFTVPGCDQQRVQRFLIIGAGEEETGVRCNAEWQLAQTEVSLVHMRSVLGYPMRGIHSLDALLAFQYVLVPRFVSLNDSRFQQDDQFTLLHYPIGIAEQAAQHRNITSAR